MYLHHTSQVHTVQLYRTGGANSLTGYTVDKTGTHRYRQAHTGTHRYTQYTQVQTGTHRCRQYIYTGANSLVIQQKTYAHAGTRHKANLTFKIYINTHTKSENCVQVHSYIQ